MFEIYNYKEEKITPLKKKINCQLIFFLQTFLVETFPEL